MAELSRRRVSYTQLEQLWEISIQNKSLATGYNKTSQAREFSKRMWENAACSLNSHGDGAIKDGKGWCKYWNDYKSNLKKKASLARSSTQQTGGGPCSVKPMTDIEKKKLQILGHDFGMGMAGIRVEPFPVEEQSQNPRIEESTPTIEDADSESTLTLNVSPNPCQDPGLGAESPQPGPSSRHTPPTVTPPPLCSTNRDTQCTPRRTPRSSLRRRRREPVLTQEAARRKIIRFTEKRLEIEEAKLQSLQALVNELRELKDFLKSRFGEHPTTGE